METPLAAIQVGDIIQRHMQESVSSRDKMAKFIEKLDTSDVHVKAWESQVKVADFSICHATDFVRCSKFVHDAACSELECACSIKLREMPKMVDVINTLGTLYDDLAKLQADTKIAAFSDSCFGLRLFKHFLVP